MKKLNFEELGYQLGKIGQTHVLSFILLMSQPQGAVMAPFIKPNIPLSFFEAHKDHLRDHSASLTRALNPKDGEYLPRLVKTI